MGIGQGLAVGRTSHRIETQKRGQREHFIEFLQRQGVDEDIFNRNEMDFGLSPIAIKDATRASARVTPSASRI